MNRTLWLVVLICWAGILSEGYDIGVMGAILPALATDTSWHLTPLQLGTLGSWAIGGMLVGGIVMGTLSDLYGRKRMFLASLLLFALTMAGVSWSPTPQWFAIFRFLGGLGLGGIIPVAAALTVEYSAPARRSANYGLMYSGYTLGILVAALSARAMLAHTGWRGVTALGMAPLLLVPIAMIWLPESLDYLVSSGRDTPAARLAQRLRLPVPLRRVDAVRPGWVAALRAAFAPGRRQATICFWVAMFMGLFLVYGLGTWLPQIMRRAGYELGPALLFLAVFALSSSIGGIVMGEAADRRGARLIVAASYAIGGLAIAALALHGGMVLTYVLVAIAGYGTVSTSLILTGYMTGYYPSAIRATAIGWAMSEARVGAMIGPILVGAVQQIGGGPGWSFGVFAIAAGIAAVAVLAIPAPRAMLVAQPAE